MCVHVALPRTELSFFLCISFVFVLLSLVFDYRAHSRFKEFDFCYHSLLHVFGFDRI